MGQQQLLLIILGVIIIGIAVAVALTLFSDNSATSDRNAMTTDMMHLAAKARHYYGRPTSMGGGGHSFQGILMGKLVTSQFADNANGTYTILSSDADSVKFQGVGKVLKPDGTQIIITLSVYPNGPGNIINVQ